IQIVSMKATMRTGTARRSIGSAVRRRRYAGLAIDCAKPLIESERKDALAASARAMPASGRIISSARSGESGYAVSPNHLYLNRRESVCRESGVNILKESFPKTFGMTFGAARKRRHGKGGDEKVACAMSHLRRVGRSG